MSSRRGRSSFRYHEPNRSYSQNRHRGQSHQGSFSNSHRRRGSSSRNSSLSPHRRDSAHSIDVFSNSDNTLADYGSFSKIWIGLKLNGHSISFQMDTGATCSMIGLPTYAQMGLPECSPSAKIVRSYGGNIIPIKGTLDVTVSYNKLEKQLSLFVVDSNDCVNIMGLDWFKELNFSINHNQNNIFKIDVQSHNNLKDQVIGVCKRYQKLFNSEAIGHCTSIQADINLKPDAIPKYFKARLLPFAIQSKVKDELSRLVKQNILKPIKTTQWATPIVPVLKPNGDIRICADFKISVNPQVETDRHPIPRIEELFYKLQGGAYFTKIDLQDAYLQVELSDRSKKCMVINTPFGLYEYQRLPFGVSSAPGIFQRLMEQLTVDIEFCAVYLDDVIISGKTNSEHISNLKLFLSRLEGNGFRCRLDKCEFAKSGIEYLGHMD